METQRTTVTNGSSYNPTNLTPVRETITPAKAAHWLALGGKQRHLTTRHVERLAAEMREGRWDSDNGETIKISAAGQVLDGQHRLSAIVESGEPITALVVYGVPESSFATIDTGRPRFGADLLAIAGHADTAVLAAAARLVMTYNYGINNPDYSVTTAHAVARPAPNVIVAFVDDNPTLALHVIAAREYKKLAIPNAIAAAMFVIAAKNDPNNVSAFFEQLLTGADLSEGDPILLLRNYLMTARGRAVTRAALTQFVAIIRGWNYHKTNTRNTRIAVHVGNKMPVVR